MSVKEKKPVITSSHAAYMRNRRYGRQNNQLSWL